MRTQPFELDELDEDEDEDLCDELLAVEAELRSTGDGLLAVEAGIRSTASTCPQS